MWLVVLVAVAAVGCGGSDKPKGKFYQPPKGDSGVDDRDASAPRKDAGPGDGPELSFTTPDPATDPNEDTVITEPLVTVHCKAKRRDGRPKVDESSVAITLEKFDAESKEEVKPPTIKVADEEFEAKFDVSGRPNGKLRFICTAKDSGTPAESSTAALETLLDLGPTIELQDPRDDSVYALQSPVVVKFKVAPSPIADGDSEAELTAVKLLISGTEHEISESEDAPGTYQTTVDFSDKKLFMVPPSSAEVLVTATNGRTPGPVTRSVKSDVKIDGDGPTIAFDSPKHLSLVHGEVTLKLTVMDPSGVKADSVRAEVNNLVITEWDVAGGSYSATFDTRAFSLDLTQLTVSVSATDVVGNQNTATIMLRLDNVPPVVSLDPPHVREWRMDGNNYYCSEAFDPVGNDARGDRTVADASSLYRAIVMDETNPSPGASTNYFAGVAENSVQLFAQKDPSVPLLIDTNGDTICDEINFNQVPEAKRPLVAKLTAVPPRGSSWYSKTVDFSEPEHTVQPIDAYCKANPNGPDPANKPDPICGKLSNPQGVMRVPAGQSSGSPPALFAQNPTNAGAGNDCIGGSWELVPVIGEGWRCLAARAEDTIGNIGVSAPIRVCFDDSRYAPDNCATYLTDALPGCTDGCTISDAQRFAPNQVWHQ